jgi:hypothetical protein
MCTGLNIHRDAGRRKLAHQYFQIRGCCSRRLNVWLRLVGPGSCLCDRLGPTQPIRAESRSHKVNRCRQVAICSAGWKASSSVAPTVRGKVKNDTRSETAVSRSSGLRCRQPIPLSPFAAGKECSFKPQEASDALVYRAPRFTVSSLRCAAECVGEGYLP